MIKIDFKIKLSYLLGFCLVVFSFSKKEVFAQYYPSSDIFKINFTQCSEGGGSSQPTVTSEPGAPTATPGSVSPEPTEEPEPVSTDNLFIKAELEGLSQNPSEVAVTIRTGKDFSKTVILSEEGESGPIPLTGLTIGQSYDFILSSWGFLSVKKSHTLTSGRNPASGFLDFGKVLTGDLNGDNQVNGLDWSLMKISFGKDGD